ncbi:MAG: YfhO family protein [Cyclobacteriaceae bacterium]
MNPLIKKGLITHGLAVLGFFLLTVILFYPQFFSGKQLSQHDILQGKGGNHTMIEHRENTGEEALWMNSQFSGMPAYLNGVQFSGDLIQYAYKTITLSLGHPRGIIFVSSLSFYILLLAFGARPWIAFVGAVTFSLNGFNIISIVAGHNAKFAAVALIPLILAGIHLSFEKKRWLGFGLTALSLAMQLRTGHYQIVYYTLLIVAIYGIHRLVRAVKKKEFQPFLIVSAGLVLMALLAAGTNIGKLLTVYEYGKVSIRGKSELKSTGNQSSGLDKDYAFEFSNDIFEPLFLFIPNIYGGSSTQELSKSSATAEALRKAGSGPAQIRDQIKSMPTYWGSQRLSAPYYAGSLAFVLFVIGMFYLKKENKVWLLVLVGLGIMLSWGKNFSTINYLIFDYLPFYNKFRSMTFSIIIALFALNLGAFLTLEKLFSISWDSSKIKTLLKAIAVPAGLAILLLLVSGMLGYRGSIDERLPDWLVSAIRDDRASLLRKDVFRALFFIAVFLGLLWAYAKGKLSEKVVVYSLALLLFTDVYLLSRRLFKPDSFVKSPVSNYFKPNEADQHLNSRKNPGDRVLNLQGTFGEARTSYHHESIGGYHPAKIRRYQDLIEKSISPEMNRMIGKLQKGVRDFSGLPAINMLNARFILAGSTKNAVLENPNALGNGWIVSNVTPVNSPDEELEATSTNDPLQSAIIDQSKFTIPSLSSTAMGTVELLERSPNKLIYKAEVSDNALAVFSEIYYKNGWTAYIDGEESEILRANYVLRALPLSKGAHEILFEFKPKTYFTGNTIMLICSMLVMGLFVLGIFIQVKNNLIPEEAN